MCNHPVCRVHSFLVFLQNDTPHRRLSTPMGTHMSQGGLYSRGQMRHTHSPLTGITGVSMPISNHPATEANASALTSSSSHQYDGRGISPVSDEEYEGFKSEFTFISLVRSPGLIFFQPNFEGGGLIKSGRAYVQIG